MRAQNSSVRNASMCLKSCWWRQGNSTVEASADPLEQKEISGSSATIIQRGQIPVVARSLRVWSKPGAGGNLGSRQRAAPVRIRQGGLSHGTGVWPLRTLSLGCVFSPVTPASRAAFRICSHPPKRSARAHMMPKRSPTRVAAEGRRRDRAVHQQIIRKSSKAAKRAGRSNGAHRRWP